MKMYGVIAVVITAVTLLVVSDRAESPQNWRSGSDRTRALMVSMDEIIRDQGQHRSYDRYMRLFAPDVFAYGLYEDRPTNLEGSRKHHRPVFFELRDGVLLSDEVIAAGPMAAQRCHSMLYLDGIFDGVETRSKPVHLRGQTFFRFDENDQIAERRSNHDHAFRMRRLLGDEGWSIGEALPAKLNGPGLTEAEVLNNLRKMNEAIDFVQSPEERLPRYLSFFQTT